MILETLSGVSPFFDAPAMTQPPKNLVWIRSQKLLVKQLFLKIARRKNGRGVENGCRK